jgi:hypothetical protein
MAISELLKVVPPPANPVEAKNGTAWKRAQEVIGSKLPNDFRDVGLHYGSGTFCGTYLGILNPLSADFERAVTFLLAELRERRLTYNYPYGVFPEQPGLLPWGSDENGNVLHWLTEGAPDYWPIILQPEGAEGHELERFDIPMTTFLAKAFTYELRPKYVWNPEYGHFADRTFIPTPPPKAKKVRKKKK